jgi:hypothetical protein
VIYPEARLVDGKFKHTTNIAFKDNAMGKWREITEWYGTFVENAVQATADLLATALVRLEAAPEAVAAFKNTLPHAWRMSAPASPWAPQ